MLNCVQTIRGGTPPPAPPPSAARGLCSVMSDAVEANAVPLGPPACGRPARSVREDAPPFHFARLASITYGPVLLLR